MQLDQHVLEEDRASLSFLKASTEEMDSTSYIKCYNNANYSAPNFTYLTLLRN